MHADPTSLLESRAFWQLARLASETPLKHPAPEPVLRRQASSGHARGVLRAGRFGAARRSWGEAMGQTVGQTAVQAGVQAGVQMGVQAVVQAVVPELLVMLRRVLGGPSL